MVLVIYLLLEVAFFVVAVVALPRLCTTAEATPEADKSPGPPKLAIKTHLVGVTSLVRPLRFGQSFGQIFGQIFDQILGHEDSVQAYRVRKLQKTRKSSRKIRNNMKHLRFISLSLSYTPW